MDVSGQPPTNRRRISLTSARPRRHRWGLALLAAALTLLLTLTLQLCVFPASGTVHGAPNAPQDGTPTPTATATTAIPPTMTLAVPSSGQGPVGAHLTITGSNWGSSDVLVGAVSPGGSCDKPGGWAQTFGHVRPQANQSIVYTFDWPLSLGTAGGAYNICAANSAGTASAFYQVVTSSPPALSVDPLTTNAGSLVKVTGVNFVGSGDVTLSVTDGQGKTRDLTTTLSPDANGGFSLTYQPRSTDVGDEVLHAVTSASTPQGMRPALQADAKLHVGAELTPTPGATPTTAIVAPVNPSSGHSNTPTALIVALIVVFLLTALAVGGIILFLVMRNRKRPDDGTGHQPAYGGGGNPGYGMTGAYGAPYGDRYQDNGYTGYGPGMGGTGVGSWDTTTQQGAFGGETPGWPASDEPDPNWRGRPMTGQWRGQNAYGDAPYDGYGNYGPNESGQYPPDDPWGAPGAPNRQPGQRSSGTRGGRDPYDPNNPPDTNDRGGSRGNPGAGRYPPSGPRGRGSGGGSQDWYPDRRPDDDDW